MVPKLMEYISQIVTSIGALMLMAGSLTQANLDLAKLWGFQRSIASCARMGAIKPKSGPRVEMRKVIDEAKFVSEWRGIGFEKPAGIFWVPQEIWKSFQEACPRAVAWNIITWGAVFTFTSSLLVLLRELPLGVFSVLWFSLTLAGFAIALGIASRVTRADYEAGKIWHGDLFRQEFGILCLNDSGSRWGWKNVAMSLLRRREVSSMFKSA